MSKRYLKSLDREGVLDLILGAVYAVIVLVGVLYLLNLDYVLIAVVLSIAALDYLVRVVVLAFMGSIYRQRKGKNKELYLDHKEYLDLRFIGVFKEY